MRRHLLNLDSASFNENIKLVSRFFACESCCSCDLVFYDSGTTMSQNLSCLHMSYSHAYSLFHQRLLQFIQSFEKAAYSLQFQLLYSLKDGSLLNLLVGEFETRRCPFVELLRILLYCCVSVASNIFNDAFDDGADIQLRASPLIKFGPRLEIFHQFCC